MTTIALVLARGGSKRLPGKNLKPLLGKSMLARTIDCGLTAQYVDRVVLSTDDETIATAGSQAGAEVPFLRPADLANDTATSADAALHALDAIGLFEGELVLLQPTSPMRRGSDVDDAIDVKRAGGLHSLVSVNVATAKPNGAVYVIDIPLFRETRTFYPPGVAYWPMSEDRSIDVDTAEDFSKAEIALAMERLRLTESLLQEWEALGEAVVSSPGQSFEVIDAEIATTRRLGGAIPACQAFAQSIVARLEAISTLIRRRVN